MKLLDYPKQYNISYLMHYTTNILKEWSIEQPNLDARVLLMSAANMTFEDLVMNSDSDLNPNQIGLLMDHLEKRGNHCPVSKITGFRYFWDDRFMVSDAVLDPRADSEVIIEEVLNIFNNKSAGLKIIDLGTGSGCLILTLLKQYQNAFGVAVDASESALSVAKKNAERLKLEHRVKFLQNNWLTGIGDKFDLIISNPPYIATNTIEELSPEVKFFDPIMALDGGNDGLDCYKNISIKLDNVANDNSYLLLEIGIGQEKMVKEIIERNSSFKLVKEAVDLASIIRVLIFKFIQK